MNSTVSIDMNEWNKAKSKRASGIPKDKKIKELHIREKRNVDELGDGFCSIYENPEDNYYTFNESLFNFILSCVVSEEVIANLIGIYVDQNQISKRLKKYSNLYSKPIYGIVPDVEYKCEFNEIKFTYRLAILYKPSIHILDSVLVFDKEVNKDWINEFLTASYNYAYPQKHIDDRADNKVLIFTNNNGNWICTCAMPMRPIESIFIDNKIKDRVLKETKCTKFIEWYRSKGISSKKVFLFHGKPGTGKTSFIKSIASELNTKIYMLNLNSVKNDSEFMRLIQFFNKYDEDGYDECEDDIKDKFKYDILVIEDIDCIFHSRKTLDSESSSVTMSTILNVLDGVVSIDRLIIFLTTNYPDKLDPALKRPGRVDHIVEFKYPTIKQIRDCYLWINDLDKCDRIKKFTDTISKKHNYMNVSLGLYQQFFIICYKLGKNVDENISLLDTMLQEYREIDDEKQANGIYM